MSVNTEAKASAEAFVSFTGRDVMSVICMCKAHSKSGMVRISSADFIKFAEFSGISCATNKGAGELNCAILKKLGK